MNQASVVIAIDGPAASGKGTLARRLAQHLGFAYLDTGAIYRATARDVIAAGQDPNDPAVAAVHAAQLDPATFNDPALRDEAIGRGASIVAAHTGVRDVLLAFQRNFARHPPQGSDGAILDGRDIGTVICPDALVKLYVVASPQVRARRRCLELAAAGLSADETSILDDILERDRRDASRATAPLKAAEDAVIIDTSDMGVEAVFEAALAIVEGRLKL